jgi:hypothetical protein
MARQDTGTADAGNSDDEYLSALEATGADEFEEAAPSPGEQARPQGQDEAVDTAWRPGFTGEPQPDEPAVWGEPGADATEEEGSALEREAVPI